LSASASLLSFSCLCAWVYKQGFDHLFQHFLCIFLVIFFYSYFFYSSFFSNSKICCRPVFAKFPCILIWFDQGTFLRFL
jgi:hypothetical protein